MLKPKVETRCPAAVYAGGNERIVEVSLPTGTGFLMSVRANDDGSMRVDLYRADGRITVHAGSGFNVIHRPHVVTLDEMKEAVPNYFSPDTMRFFDSRVCSEVTMAHDGTAYFVTSERYDESTPRLYSVRRYYPARNGERAHIETVGGFLRYTSRSGALDAARRAAATLAE